MKKIILLLFICFQSACGNRPIPQKLDSILLTNPQEIKTNGEASALWLALTDYRANGQLARIDLQSGKIEWNKLPTGIDVLIYPDTNQGLFLLQRMQSDSIHRIQGSEATLTASLALSSKINPQFITRDPQQKIWLVGLDSNNVEVFNPQLTEKIGQIDLSALKSEQDDFAELYGITSLNSSTMAIIAARLERPAWKPASQSALALIDSNTFQILNTKFLNIPNAMQIFSPASDSLLIIGAGSQDPSIPMYGNISFSLGGNDFRVIELRSLQNRIIHSSISKDGILATIDWYPERKESCIRFGIRNLFCEQNSANNGYAFSKIQIIGNTIFVAYYKNGNSELWVIPINGNQIQRLPMPLPINALSPGP